MKSTPIALTASATFVALVVASNLLTAHYGMVLEIATAGTVTAGLVLVARDAVRESAGLLWSFACVAIGVGVSFFMAGPALAIASAAAFALAECFDAFAYEPLRKSGRIRALAWSNVVGSVVDSVAFLLLAGFPLWPDLLGQTLTKWFFAVLLPLLILWGARAVLRHRIRPASA